MATIKSFEDLEVWQLSVELAVKIYQLLSFFPKEEKYGIIDQLKRAIVSISANIAESFGRFHYKDSVKFLYNARGSLQESRSHLLVAEKLGQIPKSKYEEYSQILKDLKNLEVKLNNFISVIIKRSKSVE
ncbi:four helix bundle protein [Candidatus Daviesbacteria bacterium]|nr:four helix bundle protein [Candidatus Daviesbacteria bacterium]